MVLIPEQHGSDGVVWQVQTTLLSVGFAGLPIAAQLFAEAPLAIGASRKRVLEYICAGWFVGVGLIGNAVIAVETIWLPSHLGVFYISLWFAATVFMLVVSTARLYRTMLDDAVRTGVTGPGRGHRGTTTGSSATGSHPTTGSSDKPLPGPASNQPTPPLKTAS